MATITSAVGAAGNWTAGSAWIGGVAPTAADDAVIPLATTSITIDAGAICRSANFNTFTGTLTQGATGTLTIGDGTAGLGNVALNLPAGATYAPNIASTISFISTSATQQTISVSSGYSLGNITINSASNGNYAVTANMLVNIASIFTFTKGTLHLDGASDNSGLTHSFGFFQSGAGSLTRALYLGASNITITSANQANCWAILSATGLTLTSGTSTITIAGANSNFNGGNGLTYYNLVMNAGGTSATYFGNGNVFNNFSFIGTAVKTDTLKVGNPFTVNGTLKIAGNSATNRVIVISDTIGTTRTITLGASATFRTAGTQHCDIQDITMTGGAANERDLSAITGLSGDCGGNTGITFTTTADQHWVNDATGNWSDSTKWTSRVPLPQDNVYFDRSFTSRTITMDMPRAGKTIDWSSASGTVTWANSVAPNIYGSLDLTNLTTLGAISFTVTGRSSYTIKSAGKSFSSAFYIWGVNGTYTLLDAFLNTGTLNINAGSFVDGGYNITADAFFANGTSITRSVTKTGNWIFTRSTGTTVFTTDLSSNKLTWGDTAGSITITGAPASAVTLAVRLYDWSYNNIIIYGANGKFNFDTSGTVKNMTILAPNTLLFFAGTTTTITNDLKISSSAGKMVILGVQPQTSSLATPILNYLGTNIENLNYLQVQGVNVRPDFNTYGKALDFKGEAASGGIVTVPNSNTANRFYGSTSFSWESWNFCRGAGGANSGRLWDKTASNYYAFMSTGGIYYTAAVNLGGTTISANGPVMNQQYNALHHVVAVWNGTTLTVYTDGVAGTPVAATGAIVDDTAATFNIGNRVALDRTFDGQIFATRLYRNVALTAGNVATLYAAGTKASNPIGNATSEYLFNDTPSGTTLTDGIAGVNGTISGALWSNGINGKWFWGNTERGIGLDFKGQTASGDYVTAPNSATANQWKSSTSFSVEAWFLARSTGSTNGRLIDKNLSSVGYSLYASTGISFNGSFSVSGVVTASSPNITYNQLNHVVGVWSGTSLTVYVNGVAGTPVATSGVPNDDTANFAYLGNSSALSRTFDGIIYATRIYRNKALSAGEVTTAYNAGAKALLPVSGCTSQYMFDEGTGSTLTDSVNAVNGTITGAGWTTNWTNKLGLNFRGQASAGDVVTIANSATANQFLNSTSYSVDAWFIIRSGGAIAGRIYDTSYFTINTQTGISFVVTISGGTYTINSATTPYNNLYHVVANWDSSTNLISLWINGVAVTPVATSGTATAGAGTVSIGNTGGIRTLDGNILAIRVYRNKALSLTDVYTAYYAGPKASLPVSGATQQFLFNEGTGSTLTDSVNAVNGTISGAQWSNLQWGDVGQNLNSLWLGGD